MAAILVTALVSAMLVGFIASVTDDQRSSLRNRDQTTAYAAAHAGLEQLTSDLGDLFAASYRPTAAQVSGLVGDAPVMAGITFEDPGGGSGYHISFADTNPADGYPDMEPEPRVISAGPYQGLLGTVTPYTIEVTARTRAGGESRMRRSMQTVLIPAFQFGMFSHSDLSFFAGPPFDFGGRVHTNGNLFVAEGNGNTLWLRDRVTAVGEIVRRTMVNGWPTSSSYTGTVRVARFPGDTTGVAMAPDDQSWAGAAGSVPPAPQEGVTPSPGSNEPAWTTFSVTTSAGVVKNARTGARALALPIAQMGAEPIELIRRPAINSSEDTVNPAVFGQRYFSRASLRIMLSDTADDLTTLPGVTAAAPVNLTTLALAATAPPLPAACFDAGTGRYTTIATCGLPALPADPAAYYAPSGAWMRPGAPLMRGYLKIEMQQASGAWVDVTSDILALGYTGRRLSAVSPPTQDAWNFAPPIVHAAGQYYLNDTSFGSAPAVGSAPPCAEPNPNAIIRIQRVRDDHSPSVPCGVNSPWRFDYIPNVLYDAREGNVRDNNAGTLAVGYLGGVIHYVELDVTNLARWFAGQIGAGGFGPLAESADNGYLVYVSDRRDNQRVGGQETGEYGFEDVINSADAAQGLPNSLLDEGEDVNGNGFLDSLGSLPQAWWLDGTRLTTGATTNGTTVSGAVMPTDTIRTREARSNPALFFRRAVKVVNGAGAPGNIAVSPLVVLPDGRGLTIVSENPVYVQGNFNTGLAGTFGSTQNDHRPAGIIADALTLLSSNWNDIRSFTYTHGGATYQGWHSPGRRPATTTWYRAGVAAGKSLPFPRPAWAGRDFGTDGGAHNFLRYIENWGGQTLNYRGSILSFYASRQAVGTFKCCANTYSPPSRGYNFDTEFLQLNLLPPKSPAFRDINALSFRQILRPTQ